MISSFKLLPYFIQNIQRLFHLTNKFENKLPITILNISVEVIVTTYNFPIETLLFTFSLLLSDLENEMGSTIMRNGQRCD